MKRTPREELDETARTLKKERITIAPLGADAFGATRRRRVWSRDARSLRSVGG